MATKEIKPIFKARDGSEHPSRAAVQRHHKRLDAQDRFVQAADEVMRCLGETALTADGQPFDMRASGTYWWVRPSFFGMPEVFRLWIWPHNAKVEIEDERIVYREFDHERREYATYPISELYTTERAARAAQVVAARKRIEELQQQVAEMERESATA